MFHVWVGLLSSSVTEYSREQVGHNYERFFSNKITKHPLSRTHYTILTIDPFSFYLFPPNSPQSMLRSCTSSNYNCPHNMPASHSITSARFIKKSQNRNRYICARRDISAHWGLRAPSCHYRDRS